MLVESGCNRYFEVTLKMHTANVLVNMEEDTELFETLLYLYSNRLHAVNNVTDRHTDYGLKTEKINNFCNTFSSNIIRYTRCFHVLDR